MIVNMYHERTHAKQFLVQMNLSFSSRKSPTHIDKFLVRAFTVILKQFIWLDEGNESVI